MNAIRSNSDKLLLGALLLTFLVVGLARLDYAGDGLRHLGPILRSNHPALGEPRWLLFPLLLFAVVKPFAIIGLIRSEPQAARLFCLFNIACAFTYLVCLRVWLKELLSTQRAAVLLLAGGSSAFLALATDIIEPTPAVAIAVAGLTFARFHAELSDGRRLTIAVMSLVMASLIYQGLLFGFAFLPAIFPAVRLNIRQIGFRVASGILAVPLITTILLFAEGDTLGNAVRRFSQGEANTAASKQYSRISAKNLAGVAVVGPVYALASIPELRGLSGTMRMLKRRSTALEGFRGAAAWLLALLAFVAAMALLCKKRQFALLVAFSGMMTLPVIRMSQYSYVKYYVLLPLLIVMIMPRLEIHYGYPAFLGALLLLSNVGHIWVQRLESQALWVKVAQNLYSQIPQMSCFLATGWGPPVPGWRGDSISLARILNEGNERSQQRLAEVNSQLLRHGLKNLFCTCQAVVTDNFVEPNVASLQQELSSFGIVGIPLPQLVVSGDTAEIFRTPRFALFRYSADGQRRACAALQ